MDDARIIKTFSRKSSREPLPSLNDVVEFARTAAERFADHWEVNWSESDLVAQAHLALYLFARYRDASLDWNDMPVDITPIGMMAFGALTEFVARREMKSSMERSTEIVAALAATERAHQKHANSPKQQAKLDVYACWQNWQRRRSERCNPYKTKASFARDMLDKFPVLASQKVIEDWCREWERGDTPAPGVEHQVMIHIGS